MTATLCVFQYIVDFQIRKGSPPLFCCAVNQRNGIPDSGEDEEPKPRVVQLGSFGADCLNGMKKRRKSGTIAQELPGESQNLSTTTTW